MRWKKFVGGLALGLTVASGCKQPIFLTEADYQNAQTMALPKDLPSNPEYASLKPDLTGKLIEPPTTVLSPDRPMYNLSLTEAVALALENGNVAGVGVNN